MVQINEMYQAAGSTWIYTYNNTGNILSKTQYAYTIESLGPVLNTVNYFYKDPTWVNLMTAYNGQGILHDTLGSFLTVGNLVCNWGHGRELASLTASKVTWTFAYDANEICTARSNGTRPYSYTYNGSRLSRVTIDNHGLDFTYDASSSC